MYIQTTSSKCPQRLFHNLVFMNIKFLKVLSSLTTLIGATFVLFNLCFLLLLSRMFLESFYNIILKFLKIFKIR